jgi:hypothetical protein
MDDNNLLMIILAFIVGYCLQGMMKNMCGGRLLEGSLANEKCCTLNADCASGLCKWGADTFFECLPLGIVTGAPTGLCKNNPDSITI